MIYIKRHNLCFVRIPKNASSSMMEFLYHNIVNSKEDIVSYIKDWDTKKLIVRDLNFQQFPHSHVDVQYIIDNNVVPKTANFFGIIRNPLEKFLSYYIYYNRQASKNSRYACPTREEFKKWFSSDGKFITPKGTITNHNISENRDHHSQRQVDFLKYNGEIIGEFWLYDNLNNHISDLCNRLQIRPTFQLPHTNKSMWNKKDLIDGWYNHHMIKNIKEYYKEDFDMYYDLKKNYNSH